MKSVWQQEIQNLLGSVCPRNVGGHHVVFCFRAGQFLLEFWILPAFQKQLHDEKRSTSYSKVQGCPSVPVGSQRADGSIRASDDLPHLFFIPLGSCEMQSVWSDCLIHRRWSSPGRQCQPSRNFPFILVCLMRRQDLNAHVHHAVGMDILQRSLQRSFHRFRSFRFVFGCLHAHIQLFGNWDLSIIEWSKLVFLFCLPIASLFLRTHAH
mmetsp:Transcript_46925/g.110480  ORF Transcript_46925/g.110480 Transcript_46925/m.110480 type:complete len:209 (+) Transcript_46925:967-1593(+)